MVGRTIILIILVAILAFGGIIWFDYLNVIDAKGVLAPIYNRLPFIPGEGRTQPRIGPDEILNLDAERLAIRLEAMELRNREMDIRQQDLDVREGEILQMAEELEEQRKAVEEMQISLRAREKDADERNRNIEQNARYLTGMPPQNAVNILNGLDDQYAIDIIRKTEDIARAEGTVSIVAFWFSLMEPGRAADLQRKMAGRPSGL